MKSSSITPLTNQQIFNKVTKTNVKKLNYSTATNCFKNLSEEIEGQATNIDLPTIVEIKDKSNKLLEKITKQASKFEKSGKKPPAHFAEMKSGLETLRNQMNNSETAIKEEFGEASFKVEMGINENNKKIEEKKKGILFLKILIAIISTPLIAAGAAIVIFWFPVFVIPVVVLLLWSNILMFLSNADEMEDIECAENQIQVLEKLKTFYRDPEKISPLLDTTPINELDDKSRENLFNSFFEFYEIFDQESLEIKRKNTITKKLTQFVKKMNENAKEAKTDNVKCDEFLKYKIILGHIDEEFNILRNVINEDPSSFMITKQLYKFMACLEAPIPK